MNVPFSSVLDEDQRSDCGAFFRMLRVDPGTFVGALLLIDGRGEPLEFVYNKASVAHRLLWREADLERAVTRELLVTLLQNCPREPSAFFFLAREVPGELFADEIDIGRPVARVATEDEFSGAASIEEHEPAVGRDATHLLWVRGRPSDATPAQRLVGRLASHGLLLEPFERVLAGLRESYELGDAETLDGAA